MKVYDTRKQGRDDEDDDYLNYRWVGVWFPVIGKERWQMNIEY
jgi:hypothetical protein